MDFYTALAFIGAMFIFAASPGPGLFGLVSRALSSGFSHAAVMSVGIILGDIVYLLMAIYGLGYVAASMGELFIIVKYIGGLYLIYLGYKIFTAKIEKKNIHGIKELSWYKNFTSGLLITLSNPKVIVFYLGFLPAFMNLTTLTNFDILVTTFIVLCVLAIVLLAYAYLAAKSRELFKSTKAMRRLNFISGSVMIGAGGYLIAKN